MKLRQTINSTYAGTQWTRYTSLRVILALGSLISMVLASGAGGHWT